MYSFVHFNKTCNITKKVQYKPLFCILDLIYIDCLLNCLIQINIETGMHWQDNDKLKKN